MIKYGSMHVSLGLLIKYILAVCESDNLALAEKGVSFHGSVSPKIHSTHLNLR